MWPNILGKNHSNSSKQHQRPSKRALSPNRTKLSPPPPPKVSRLQVMDHNQHQHSWAPTIIPIQYPHSSTQHQQLIPSLPVSKQQSTILSDTAETQIELVPSYSQLDVCLSQAPDYFNFDDEPCGSQINPCSRVPQQFDRLLSSSCSCRDDNCYDPLLSANPYDHSVRDCYSPVKVVTSSIKAFSNNDNNCNSNKENHQMAHSLQSIQSSSSIVSHCSSSSSVPSQSMEIVKRIKELELDYISSQSASSFNYQAKQQAPLYQAARNEDLHNGSRDSDEGIFSIVSSMSSARSSLEHDDMSPTIDDYLGCDDHSASTSPTEKSKTANKVEINDFKDDDNCCDGNVNKIDNRITSTLSGAHGEGTSNRENRKLVDSAKRPRKTYTRNNLSPGSKLQTNNRDKKRLQQQQQSVDRESIYGSALKPTMKRKSEDTLCDSETSIADTRKKRKKTPEQLAELETIFDSFAGCVITKEKRLEIAESLNLDPEEVRCWFKYKRSRRYNKLKRMSKE